jgi:hypothetical protein
MCAANTIIITIESENKKRKQHNSSLFYFSSCFHCPHLQYWTNHDGLTTNKVSRTSEKSPRQNKIGQKKVGQKTGKVRKNTIATRRSLNGKSTGKRIATKPAPKVYVASDDINSNDEVEEVEEVDNNHYEQRQKRKVSSNVKVDHVLEQPMMKKIMSSRDFAVKRKKRPGKARKPVRAPELHKSSSSFEDETDPSSDDDGKLFQAASIKSLLLQPQ